MKKKLSIKVFLLLLLVKSIYAKRSNIFATLIDISKYYSNHLPEELQDYFSGCIILINAFKFNYLELKKQQTIAARKKLSTLKQKNAILKKSNIFDLEILHKLANKEIAANEKTILINKIAANRIPIEFKNKYKELDFSISEAINEQIYPYKIISYFDEKKNENQKNRIKK